MNSNVRQFVGASEKIVPLLLDESITDILINGPDCCYVERDGLLEQIESPFQTESDLMGLVERLLVPMGRQLNAARPFIDGRLLDGSRFHLMLAPLSPVGTLVSIRKFRRSDQVQLESFAPAPVTQWLREQMAAKKNILIIGGTGSGKTTLLSRLLDEIAPSERLLILEESCEIQTNHTHSVRLETRASNADGLPPIDLTELLRNALRMRPDRIVVGECRGREAFDMLQAMNSGHSGSLGTLHANSARDGLRRLEALALLAGLGLSQRTVQSWIGSNIDILINVERDAKARKISEISEICGLESDVYVLRPVYQGGVLIEP